MIGRSVAAAAGAAVALLALAPSASAHVTVQPPEAVQGSYAKLTFRVPNESDTAATVKLEVQLPEEIERARTKPTLGWTSTVDGRTITWEGGRIEPGEFQEFDISVGPLPEVERLLFKAIQTYEDGEVARWIEETTEGGGEPEFPAPTLTLTEGHGEGGHGGSWTSDAESEDEAELTAQPVATSVDQDDVDSAKTFGIIGIVIGALGLLAGVGGLAAARRRS